MSFSCLTSALCVGGVKYGALSLLFIILTVNVAVPDKLGVPERFLEKKYYFIMLLTKYYLLLLQCSSCYFIILLFE